MFFLRKEIDAGRDGPLSGRTGPVKEAEIREVFARQDVTLKNAQAVVELLKDKGLTEKEILTSVVRYRPEAAAVLIKEDPGLNAILKQNLRPGVMPTETAQHSAIKKLYQAAGHVDFVYPYDEISVKVKGTTVVVMLKGKDGAAAGDALLQFVKAGYDLGLCTNARIIVKNAVDIQFFHMYLSGPAGKEFMSGLGRKVAQSDQEKISIEYVIKNEQAALRLANALGSTKDNFIGTLAEDIDAAKLSGGRVKWDLSAVSHIPVLSQRTIDVLKLAFPQRTEAIDAVVKGLGAALSVKPSNAPAEIAIERSTYTTQERRMLIQQAAAVWHGGTYGTLSDKQGFVSMPEENLINVVDVGNKEISYILKKLLVWSGTKNPLVTIALTHFHLDHVNNLMETLVMLVSQKANFQLAIPAAVYKQFVAFALSYFRGNLLEQLLQKVTIIEQGATEELTQLPGTNLYMLPKTDDALPHFVSSVGFVEITKDKVHVFGPDINPNVLIPLAERTEATTTAFEKFIRNLLNSVQENRDRGNGRGHGKNDQKKEQEKNKTRKLMVELDFGHQPPAIQEMMSRTVYAAAEAKGFLSNNISVGRNHMKNNIDIVSRTTKSSDNNAALFERAAQVGLFYDQDTHEITEIDRDLYRTADPVECEKIRGAIDQLTGFNCEPLSSWLRVPPKLRENVIKFDISGGALNMFGHAVPNTVMDTIASLARKNGLEVAQSGFTLYFRRPDHGRVSHEVVRNMIKQVLEMSIVLEEEDLKKCLDLAASDPRMKSFVVANNLTPENRHSLRLSLRQLVDRFGPAKELMPKYVAVRMVNMKKEEMEMTLMQAKAFVSEAAADQDTLLRDFSRHSFLYDDRKPRFGKNWCIVQGTGVEPPNPYLEQIWNRADLQKLALEDLEKIIGQSKFGLKEQDFVTLATYSGQDHLLIHHPDVRIVEEVPLFAAGAILREKFFTEIIPGEWEFTFSKHTEQTLLSAFKQEQEKQGVKNLEILASKEFDPSFLEKTLAQNREKGIRLGNTVYQGIWHGRRCLGVIAVMLEEGRVSESFMKNNTQALDSLRQMSEAISFLRLERNTDGSGFYDQTGVTSLYNKVVFEKVGRILQQAITRLPENGINEEWWRSVTNEIELRLGVAYVSIIKELQQKKNLLFRIGGDEFSGIVCYQGRIYQLFGDGSGIGLLNAILGIKDTDAKMGDWFEAFQLELQQVLKDEEKNPGALSMEALLDKTAKRLGKEFILSDKMLANKGGEPLLTKDMAETITLHSPQGIDLVVQSSNLGGRQGAQKFFQRLNKYAVQSGEGLSLLKPAQADQSIALTDYIAGLDYIEQYPKDEEQRERIRSWANTIGDVTRLFWQNDDRKYFPNIKIALNPKALDAFEEAFRLMNKKEPTWQDVVGYFYYGQKTGRPTFSAVIAGQEMRSGDLLEANQQRLDARLTLYQRQMKERGVSPLDEGATCVLFS